jgi:hypothetical protein
MHTNTAASPSLTDLVGTVIVGSAAQYACPTVIDVAAALMRDVPGVYGYASTNRGSALLYDRGFRNAELTVDVHAVAPEDDEAGVGVARLDGWTLSPLDGGESVSGRFTADDDGSDLVAAVAAWVAAGR